MTSLIEVFDLESVLKIGYAGDIAVVSWFGLRFSLLYMDVVRDLCYKIQKGLAKNFSYIKILFSHRR